MADKGRRDHSRKQPTALAAMLVVDNDPLRKALTIKNAGTVTVYLGDSDAVTAETGFPLEAGDVLTDDVSVERYYGIAASGTGDLRIIEV